jgi:hypothetical protein
MNTYDWVISGRISDLERTARRLTASNEANGNALKENVVSATDAGILATQAYLMAFHQLAILSPDPREFRDYAISTLKAQGLSKKALKEIEQWTAAACDAIAKKGHHAPAPAHPTVNTSERKQPALVS